MIRYHFRSENVFLYVNNTEFSFEIDLADTIQGKSFLCRCVLNGRIVTGRWTLVSGSQYVDMNQNGKVTIHEGAVSAAVTVQCEYGGLVKTKTVTVSYDNQLTIECADTLLGTSGNAIALYNSQIITPVWSVTAGSDCIQIDSAGAIIISQSGSATLQASYNGYTAQKTVAVQYDSGTSSQTTVNDDGSITTETQTVVENPDGSTTTTSESITVNDDGSTSQT